MLLVHSTSAISRENIPFQVCIIEWVQPTRVYCFITKMRKCWEAVPVTGCPLLPLHLVQFHIFFYNWKWEILSIIRCTFLFIYLFFTGPIIHDIHLCLRALASTDQSLIGGKHEHATESRLYSTIKSFGDEEEQNCPQNCFPSLFTAFEEIRTKSSTMNPAFQRMHLLNA